MGDAAADEHRRRVVEGLYEQVRPRLYRYAVMILADAQDAEDVVQQVFAAALSQPLPRVIDEPLAYLRAAVRNAAFSMLRTRKSRRATNEQLLEPLAAGCSPTERAILEEALRALRPEQREVVHLHVYEGMTFQEIADATGESINTISGRYRYALDGMRRLLGNDRTERP